MIAKDNYPALIETVVVAGLLALLGLLGLYIVPAFYLVTLLLPVPLAYLIIKNNLLYGLLSLGLATFMLIVAFGHIGSALMLVMQFGPTGVIIGLLIKNKVSVDSSMAVLFFWALAVAALNLFVSFVLSGVGYANVTTEFRAAMDQVAEMYRQNGMMDEIGRQQFQQVADQIIHLVQVLLPGTIAVWTIFMTIFTYFITRLLIRKLGYDAAPEFKFLEWRLPWYSIWLVITGLAMAMAGEEFSLRIVNIIGKNILYISAFIFFVLGTAVLMFFLRAWKMPKVVKIIITVALFLYLPLATAIILSLGVVDPVANLRRLSTDSDEGSKGG
ncbi:Uncharacterized conserved protein YybS, DUF2232 family [Desulfotomaculum arcticum]|uniref:Uncharacterized conserved protein YybS, DUF2232 family n=1 Tax=Desulfotruncus arcticus DSM 17038 TaxID=1121424 RepID=A0A1I2VLC5_9FIRM|nr:DUF2232 domain-containing protein [Desulfotruncus arcticus]SFG90124.1 Uncharacterized conserved protein YybS, DUF2232 family [Desulfotomaculum arcticum] [Desulfotruncus arcticus DSM 17038]